MVGSRRAQTRVLALLCLAWLSWGCLGWNAYTWIDDEPMHMLQSVSTIVLAVLAAVSLLWSLRGRGPLGSGGAAGGIGRDGLVALNACSAIVLALSVWIAASCGLEAVPGMRLMRQRYAEYQERLERERGDVEEARRRRLDEIRETYPKE